MACAFAYIAICLGALSQRRSNLPSGHGVAKWVEPRDTFHAFCSSPCKCKQAAVVDRALQWLHICQDKHVAYWVRTSLSSTTGERTVMLNLDSMTVNVHPSEAKLEFTTYLRFVYKQITKMKCNDCN